MTTIIKLPLSIQIMLGLESGPSNEYVPLAEFAALEAALRQAQDDNTRLREAQFKHAKTLKRMVKAWRDEADGHYCQTYNTGQAKGLNVAANHLERYVKEAWREPET